MRIIKRMFKKYTTMSFLRRQESTPYFIPDLVAEARMMDPCLRRDDSMKKIAIHNAGNGLFQHPGFQHRGEKGIALILTLGILSLITVMAVAFATLMRHEEKMSKNSIYLTQARTIAKAGLNYSIGVLIKDLEDDQTAVTMSDSLDEEWITYFNGTDTDVDGDGTADATWYYIHQNSNGTGPVIGRFAVKIEDEAGKINVNASSNNNNPVKQNEGWSTYEIDMTAITDIGSTINTSIIEYRHGTDTQPGADSTAANPPYWDDNFNETPLENDGIDNDGDGLYDSDDIAEGDDEPTEFDPEIPWADDVPFTSLDELSRISGIGETFLDAHRDDLTVSSRDANKYYGTYWREPSTIKWRNKININHFMATADIYNIISAANIYRFGTNVIDYADRDYYPTIVTDGGNFTIPSDNYMGIEGLQIMEILYDSNSLNKENDQDNIGADNDVIFTVVSGTCSALGSTDDCEASSVATWEWPWDPGTYEITIWGWEDSGCLAGSNSTYEFEYDGAIVSGSLSGVGSVTNTATISGAIGSTDISLRITVCDDDPGVAGIPNYHFDRITVEAGKYIELINISQQDISIDISDLKIVLGGTLDITSSATVQKDGMPLTISGGTEFPLSTSWNVTSNFSMSEHSAGAPPTYQYLLIADSLYAVESVEAYNRGGSGHWGDDWGEEGTILVLTDNAGGDTFHNSLADAGVNIALVDSNNNVIAFAPATDTLNITGYTNSSPGSGQGVSRISAVDQILAWVTVVSTPSIENAWDLAGWANNPNRQPPEVYASSQDQYWSVKDRPYASIGEIGDVHLGDDHAATYDAEATTNTYFDKITVSDKRLEAEYADSTNGWINNGSGSDGTTRYQSPDMNEYDWDWTFDLANSGEDKSFRLRIGETYNVSVYGQFDYNFQSPSGTTHYVKPNHGIGIGEFSIVNNPTPPFSSLSSMLSIPIKGDVSNNPKLNFVVISPAPYTWGRININTATSEVLQGLPGIASGLATNIISYRKGPFGHFEQLQEITQVSSIGEVTFKPISNLITVRSDVYRVMVKAETIFDTDGDGVEGDASDKSTATFNLDTIIDRNPVLRYPETKDRYRIEQIK